VPEPAGSQGDERRKSERSDKPIRGPGDDGEVFDWLARRLFQRGIEAARESDRDVRGVVTILGWLSADEYTFAQKVLSAVPVVHIQEVNVVGEQLRRLRYRCQRILTTGHDPAGRQPFTCAIPTFEEGTASHLLAEQFELMLIDGSGESLKEETMRDRFQRAGDATQGVARWIKAREFGVTQPNPSQG